MAKNDPKKGVFDDFPGVPRENGHFGKKECDFSRRFLGFLSKNRDFWGFFGFFDLSSKEGQAFHCA